MIVLTHSLDERRRWTCLATSWLDSSDISSSHLESSVRTLSAIHLGLQSWLSRELLLCKTGARIGHPRAVQIGGTFVILKTQWENFLLRALKALEIKCTKYLTRKLTTEPVLGQVTAAGRIRPTGLSLPDSPWATNEKITVLTHHTLRCAFDTLWQSATTIYSQLNVS